MKLFVICQGNYDSTDILGVYDNQEKAERLTEDSNLYIEEFELNQEIPCVYKVEITLTGFINSCCKVLRQHEGICKSKNYLTVYTKANNKEEAIEIAKQKLTDNTVVRTVKKLEWIE
jgi:hypothetical protein